MINISSPFLNEIQECRVVMKKLRKKIHKHFLTAPPNRKSKEQNNDLLNILKSRNLPNFVIDPLKKKRSVDFNFLKNVMISNMASPQEISKLTSNQQNQIQSLFIEHKQRLRTIKKKMSLPDLDKKSTRFSNVEVEESEQISMIHQNINCEINDEQFNLKAQINGNNFQCDNFILNGLSFLLIGKQMESDQQWLKF